MKITPGVILGLGGIIAGWRAKPSEGKSVWSPVTVGVPILHWTTGGARLMPRMTPSGSIALRQIK